MVTVHEHSFEETLLPKRALILDLGCRGFEFTDTMRERGHHVIPVDADPLLDRQDYVQAAITDRNGTCSIEYIEGNPLATTIKEGKDVLCMTLGSLLAMAKVTQCDLIKMDIEGSELQVIQSLNKAPAKQMSIEFHVRKYGKEVMDQLVDKLKALGYRVAQHNPTPNGNYYDSVFILDQQ